MPLRSRPHWWLLLASIFCGACATVSPPPVAPAPASPAPAAPRAASRGPSRDEVVRHATGIYLARVERSQTDVRYVVTEIWRHEPHLGTPPPIDSPLEADANRRRPPTMNVGDHVVHYVFSPELTRSNGTRIRDGAVGSFNGQVRAYKLTLEELRAQVKATRWLPPDGTYPNP